MKRTLLTSGVLLLLFCSCVTAQEKPTPILKPEPLLAVPPDTLLKSQAQDTAARGSQNLPKFELQQFVITGVVSIDVGDVEKLASDDRMSAPELANPVNAPRDRSTVEFPKGQQVSADAQGRMTGRVLGSVGTFLTTQFGLWLSLKNDDNYAFGDFQYGSSRAFVPFANRSEGHVGVKGGMTLNGPSEWYDRGVLDGSLGYGSKSYRFYGSLTPSTTRTTTQFDLLAEYNSSKESVTWYNGLAGMTVAGFTDSSQTVTETRFDLGVGYGFLLGNVSLDARLGLSLVSTNGSGEGTLPFFDGGVKSQKIWWGGFFMQGSAQFYITQGMLGQKLARIYPQAELGYRVLESTVVSLAYLGHVQFNSLTGLLQVHPYVSSTSIIRQTDVPLDLLGVVETGWSDGLRTRLSMRYQSMRDYPLFTEGGGTGFWTTAYFGTSELSTFQADLFAKFAANTYFTLSLAANSSRNTVTDWKIPYIPDVQLDATLSVEPLERLKVLPTLTVVDRRVPDLYASNRLKAYVVLSLRGEYSILRLMDVFLDFQNLTDSNYDVWNGYRASPFVASAGIRVRW